MSTDTEKAERRGYARGYTAGKKRKAAEVSYEALQRRKDAFWRQAFLAALPAAIAAQNWSRGDKPITTLDDRVKLAREVADEVLDQALLYTSFD